MKVDANMRKIMLVCGHGGKSGVPAYVNLLGKALRGEWHVQLICSENEGAFEIGETFDDLHEVQGLHRSMNPVRLITAFFSILRVLASFGPNVVWANSTIPVVLVRLCTLFRRDFQLITTYHGVPYGPGRSGFLGTALFALDSLSLLLSRRHTIVFISSRDEQLVPGFLRSRHRVVRIGNSSDLTLVAPDSPKGTESFKIGMVGRVSKQKNYGLAMQIFNFCSDDCELLLVGDGTNEASFVQEMRGILSVSAQQRVHFLGPSNGVAKFLQSLDCLLFTSRYEGMSIAAIEALQAGLVLVSTDVGGMEEFGSASPFVLNLGAWDQLNAQEAGQEIVQLLSAFRSDYESNMSQIKSGWERDFSSEQWRSKVVALARSDIDERSKV